LSVSCTIVRTTKTDQLTKHTRIKFYERDVSWLTSSISAKSSTSCRRGFEQRPSARMRFVISFPRRTTIPTILVTASKALPKSMSGQLPKASSHSRQASSPNRLAHPANATAVPVFIAGLTAGGFAVYVWKPSINAKSVRRWQDSLGFLVERYRKPQSPIGLGAGRTSDAGPGDHPRRYQRDLPGQRRSSTHGVIAWCRRVDQEQAGNRAGRRRNAGPSAPATRHRRAQRNISSSRALNRTNNSARSGR
jgi:hypothetical protein